MNIKNFLEQNVKPATGCTEPVAVGLATSLAVFSIKNKDEVERLIDPNTSSINKNASIKNREGILEEGDEILEIRIKTDRDVYKNAFSVAIPGTNGEKGMKIAAALGAFVSPYNGLNLFSSLTPEIIQSAHELIKKEKVIIEEMSDFGDIAALNIETWVTLSLQQSNKEKKQKERKEPRICKAYVNLKGIHDRVEKIMVDDEVIYERSSKVPIQDAAIKYEEVPEDLTAILEILEEIPPETRKKLLDGVKMNLAMAETGLDEKKHYGLELGKYLKDLAQEMGMEKSLLWKVRYYSAAAGDARMGGAPQPVMSTGGSGNQGITALVPLGIYAQHYSISDDKLAKAALLSHLIVKLVKKYTGHLSAICGCAIKAGMGVAAALVYLMGGTVQEINNVLNLMAANILGMICDGAKEGCALKLSTAAGTALESAYLAKLGMHVPSDNGIVFEDAIETIKGMGKISEAMIKTDHAVVKIMQEKLSKK